MFCLFIFFSFFKVVYHTLVNKDEYIYIQANRYDYINSLAEIAIVVAEIIINVAEGERRRDIRCLEVGGTVTPRSCERRQSARRRQQGSRRDHRFAVVVVVTPSRSSCLVRPSSNFNFVSVADDFCIRRYTGWSKT